MHEHRLFEGNCSYLRKYHPFLFRLVKSQPVSWIPCESNSISDGLIQTFLDQGTDFFYWRGVDGKTLLHHAPVITRENRGILLIEPSEKRFLAMLGQYDLRPLFSNRRMNWAVGKSWREQVVAVFEQSLCYAAARPGFLSGAELADGEPDTMNFLRGEVSRRKSELARRLKELPSLLPVRRNERPRVWCFDDYRGKAHFTTIQSVLIRTLFFYLRKLGYETEYTVLRDGCYYPPYYRVLKLALFEPDILFLCNQGPAYETAIGEELSRSLKIPKVIWFADDPVFAEHLLLRRGTSPEETYLVADYEWSTPLLENGANPPLYMPGGATRTRRGKKRASRKCEIVFVGQVRDYRAFFEALTPAWREYCLRVITEKLRFPRKKIRDVMAQFPQPCEIPADRMDELRQKVLWEANSRFRVNVMQLLADYDVRIYGNEEWTQRLSPDFARRAFRGIAPFRHLFEIYRNAQITLNIHSLQSYTCLNVRDFDVPVAGGFLLSDWLPRANEIFRPGFAGELPLNESDGPEVFFYRSPGEIKRLANYFLENESHRLACIERAREKILSAHTYRHRAEWLHEIFRERMASID